MSNNKEVDLIAKSYIEQLLNQLLFDYQNTQQERVKIAEWEESKEFSILGIIEILTDDIRGYSFQVLNHNSLTNFDEIINQLKEQKIFEIPEFTNWYFSDQFNYPNLKFYVEKLNYLRLLIIEYMREKQLNRND